MRKAFLLCAVSMLTSAPLCAQTPLQPSLELRASVNGIRDAVHARSLSLRRYDISVRMRGHVAETTIEASFANPTAETLEGDLRIKLPAGAIVTGYSLNVGGQMVDGVLIDRPRAKALYDARVRRGVDPGVGEVSADNVFETHVHPIFPGAGRRVRISFVVAVGPEGLHLPLGLAAPAEAWSIDVHSLGNQDPPLVRVPMGKLALQKGADEYTGKISGTGSDLGGELVITGGAQPETLVSQHRIGERDVEMTGTLSAPAETRQKPEHLRIYWDRSRARLDGDIAAETALLQQLIAKTHAATTELVAFNSSGAERVTVTSPEAAAEWLKHIQYRGATSYAAVAGDSQTGTCVLFANGGPSIDRAAPFTPHCRLDSVSSAPSADRPWLQHIASAAGGAGYVLTASNGASVAEAMAAPFAGVVAVLDQDGKRLPFVMLDAPRGGWAMLARAGEGGPVTIRLADAGGTHDVVRTLTGPVADFDGAADLIAADQLAAMGATEQRADYVAISRRYRIASPSLSFLVLESPQDYLAAKVDPPGTYPAEARDAWARQRKAQQVEQSAAQHAWTEQLAHEWAETVAWWQTRFDPKAKPKRVTTSTSFDQTAPQSAEVAEAGAPPPPPPPPPPPAMAPPAPMLARSAPAMAASAHAAQDIIVTEAREGHGAADSKAVADTATIQIDAWQPERPYLELYDGKPEAFDERFLEAEKRHGSLPIFYLDTAEWLRKHGFMAQAQAMVLSALDLPSANEVTIGMVADRLERYGANDRAIELRERQVALDPDRPQPRRLLALALARRAAIEPAKARADLTRAIELLYAIAITPQDPRWAGIEMIALNEANALLPRLQHLGGKVEMDSRLVKLLDCDMRVVVDWTSDGTDMDLWIDEPDKERAIYNNPRTAIGGHLSHDMTQGYGPEEYFLRIAPPGKYAVQSNVYAPDRLDPNGVTLLTAHLFHNFGRKNQSEESVDIEVKRDENGAKPIGQMTFGP